MLFNSYAFIFLFLPFVLLGYYWITKKKLQLWFLFISSVIFYCYWSTVYVFLLLFTVVFDFYIARLISLTENPRKRKFLLVSSITANLSILGFFKYYNFFADSVNGAFHVLGLSAPLPFFDLILPIGISFYTFQSMSYVIDVYRRTSSAHGHLLEFAGYVTLFPHQISGPLVRHNFIVPQLESAKTYFFNPENFWKGCYFFIFGLSKKMMVADQISKVVDPLVLNIGGASTAEAWIAMVGYTIQLYFDFSGYSDMAVGLGLMMNIQFPQNFNSPYKSLSITEFWQRWHITLSSWLRDYLYISLGGNRAGKLKTYRNLMLTMVIGGFWHGANWTFLVWGGLHGMVLALERYFKDKGWGFIKHKALKWLFTFAVVCIAWIFFRAPNLTVAFTWIGKLFAVNESFSADILLIPTKHKDRFFAAFIIGLGIALGAKNTWEHKFTPSLGKAILLGIMLTICLMYMGDESPFLYFQF